MPILSGFLPIPLAMMIPFMGAQSLVLGKAFGEGFQYGKRKISSMTNEEFNKLTPSDIAANSRRELQQMIPEMKASITDMRDFQSFIVHELIATAKQLPDDIFQGVTGLGSDTTAGKAASAVVSSFIPQAFGSTGPEQTQKFASDYENEAFNLGFKLLLSIVKTFGTRTDIPIEKRVGYIAAFKRLQAIEDAKKITPKTPTEAIKASGATGVVKQIATMYNEINVEMRALAKIPNNAGGAAALNAQRALVLRLIKAFNRFVQLNRKPGLTIDTAKSLSFRRIIPKT